MIGIAWTCFEGIHVTLRPFARITHRAERIHVDSCTKAAASAGQNASDYGAVCFSLVERMPNLRLGPIGQCIELIGAIECNGRDAVMNDIENFLIAEHWIVSKGKERGIS